MPVNEASYRSILTATSAHEAALVAVSKTKSEADIHALYELGQRDFGENYVQELVRKKEALPQDIRWHFIGHLQSNKVKQIAPFVHLIHGIDSLNLLKAVDKEAKKTARVIDVLLQVYISEEDTKFGLDAVELDALLNDETLPALHNVRIRGLMGMASFSGDQEIIREEFSHLRYLFDRYSARPHFDTLSMGMSGDYAIALEEGSNMIRIGSLLFGERN